ncbi:MAG: hypothetical protein IJN39_01800, partial [Clostridia bacterium]|nr:hypothetical protein [Clostridia bacterium]
MPYQAIKSDISISGVDSQATYVSLSQINASGTYKAHTNGSCIIICKASDKVDNSVILSAQVSINYFRDPTSRETRTATYAGTSDVANQLIYDIDTASLTGSWGDSGLGYASKGKYIGNAQGTATWMPTDLTPNKYTVQIYSASHQGVAGGAAPSTSKAGVDLTIGTKTYAYTLNQYNGSTGWYNLGSFELNLSELMVIKLYNASGEGLLRASAIRLIPADLDEAIYVGADNKDEQIVYDINSCNLSGSWGTSGLGYTGGSRYASESLASATWNFAPSGAGSYSVQLYSIAHAGDTNTGALPSTTAAGVRLELSDATHHYLINQCTGSTGWYNLGTFTFDAGESASITIHHTLFDGLLRANAIRLVPDVINEATYVGTTNEDNQIVYDINACTLSGSWGTSGLGYTGGSRYTGGSDATATWSVSPTAEGNYSVQVYSVAHAGDIASGAPASTTAAGVCFEILGEKHRYLLNQCTGPTGWYDLGTFAFEANQTASITLYKTLDDGHLRASAVRLVPKAPDTETGTISFVGNSDIAGQKLFGFDAATTTGKWLESGGALLGCYYGDGTTSTAKWNMIPDNTQKYSVQVYVPCIENGNTTVNGVITLEIGNRTIQYPMNQRLDTTTYMGWYTLGEFYLTKNEGATVTLSMTDGQFLRAKSARLVPVADTFSVTQSGTTVNIDTGYAYENVESVMFVEYNSSNCFDSVKILECTPKITTTLKNANNKYKIFFWKSISSMVPFRPAYEK